MGSGPGVCETMHAVDSFELPGCSQAQFPAHRRNLISQMHKRAKTSHCPAAAQVSLSQKRSSVELSSQEIAANKRRRVAPPHRRSTGDSHMLARECIFAWSGEWTYRRQAFIASLPCRDRPLMTRRHEGGGPLALRNFHYIFEWGSGKD
eukprot:2516920-Pyramimonas_sp.AAC.1